MGYQNFFATRLFTDIGAADTTITLENPPTPTSGRLVLEARNTSKREIISYTGVSGNDITGVTRGVGGTSATDHAKNSLVEMNVVAEDLSDALAVPSDIITRFNETISDHVASGLVVTDDTGLTADISAGVAYINGIRLNISAVNNRTFTASKDTYVDLGDNGVLDYNEVSNGAAAPALAANHLRLAKVVTNATDTTSVFNYTNGSAFSEDRGWISGKLPAVTSVTNNGNHCATMVFASAVDGIISPDMKLRIVRKIQAPTYMGGLFNGSSHYFIKASPSGTLGTLSNNFTVMFVHDPTVHNAQEVFVSRMDSGAANGWAVGKLSDGRIFVQVVNGGAGNFRQLATYAKLPTGKPTVVGVTWTSGTVTIYFEGHSMTVATSGTGGTNPSTAGAGGDFAIGRMGASASQYAKHYISGVAVFDAVLSQSTIRDYSNQGIVGNETNCVGAWDLNNRATDQSSGGNNLTATGGVGYTLRSPYATDANNVPNGLIEWATIGSVSGSTVELITPSGSLVPTIGGVSDVAYSMVDQPFGFPPLRRRSVYKFVQNTNIFNPTNASTDYAQYGVLVPIGCPTPITAIVSVGQGVGSTSDYEYGTQIRLNGTTIRQYTPNIALGNAGRSMHRSLTATLEIPAGNNIISLGGSHSSGTSMQVAAAGAYLTVEVIGDNAY